MIHLIFLSLSLTTSFAADPAPKALTPAVTKNSAVTRPVNPAAVKTQANAAIPKQTQLKTQTVSTPAAFLGGRTPANSHDINEAIDITGQSRNLSMGLMFQRDKDKVSFGSPRTNYKDKITSSQTNY